MEGDGGRAEDGRDTRGPRILLRSDFSKSRFRFWADGVYVSRRLADSICGAPTLLLLDRPTNHILTSSRYSGENFLSHRAGAVVLGDTLRLSTTSPTAQSRKDFARQDMTTLSATRSSGALNEARKPETAAVPMNPAEQIRDTGEFIERFRYKAMHLPNLQNRMKRLTKIERKKVDGSTPRAILTCDSHLGCTFGRLYPVIAAG